MSGEKKSWSLAKVIILLEKLNLHPADRLETSNVSGIISLNNDES